MLSGKRSRLNAAVASASLWLRLKARERTFDSGQNFRLTAELKIDRPARNRHQYLSATAAALGRHEAPYRTVRGLLPTSGSIWIAYGQGCFSIGHPDGCHRVPRQNIVRVFGVRRKQSTKSNRRSDRFSSANTARSARYSNNWCPEVGPPRAISFHSFLMAPIPKYAVQRLFAGRWCYWYPQRFD